ncbi:hypothetical protein ACRAWF_09375 [Streptomyces sp. L7]
MAGGAGTDGGDRRGDRGGRHVEAALGPHNTRTHSGPRPDSAGRAGPGPGPGGGRHLAPFEVPNPTPCCADHG